MAAESGEPRIMELFSGKAFRLKSDRSRYLVAQEDKKSVRQQKNGSEKAACWTVEFSKDGSSIRLKSCSGSYLTASNQPLVYGSNDKKVSLSSPSTDSDSLATFWEPIRVGCKLKLRSYSGGFLRGNGGALPWRNAVTHSSARFHVYSDRDLWEIDDLEFHLEPKPEHLVSSPTGDHFEDIRQLALIVYANCSNDERSAATKMFKDAVIDGNRRIDLEEFKAACVHYKVRGNIDEMFKGIDTDGNGFLDSDEAITFYYLIKNGTLFCRNCRQCLNSTYFTCVKCFFDKDVENFNVCSTCHGRQKYFHEHTDFKDNNTMLNSFANNLGKSKSKGGSKTAWEIAGDVVANASVHVALGAAWTVASSV